MFKRAHFFRFLRYGFLLAGLCLAYGFFVEPKFLVVRHVGVVSENWNGPPLTIGLLADIHIGGQHVSAARVNKITAKMNAESPDIILLGGDYVNGHTPRAQRPQKFITEIEQGMANLGSFNAPLGVYAAIGNHDAWYDGKRVEDMLSKSGIQVMDNDQVTIKRNAHNFCLIGLADTYTGQIDKKVHEGCLAKQSQLAFMHSPDSFSILPKSTALALAGHTHGGQINIPLIGRKITSTSIGPKYAYGEVDYHGIPTFITAGIGTSIMSARFRAPPEIVVITLRAP